MNIYPLKGDGKWFRGNLHCHTTMSDGKVEPSKAIAHYKSNGYDFLAITDHQLFTDFSMLGDENFMVIPAVELSVDEDVRLRGEHLLGIQNDNLDVSDDRKYKHNQPVPRPVWTGRETLQNTIDDFRSRGLETVVAHPIWSRVELEDIVHLKDYLGLEIYNYDCVTGNNNGECTVYWDSILRRGKKIWGVADDDAHGYTKKDSCGGWVMVKAERLDNKSIMKAMTEGKFYASAGPSIIDYGIEDGEVFVECSEVQTICLMSYDPRGGCRWADEGKSLTSARFKLDGDETFVRIECIRHDGKKAWTNPIFLK